MNHLASSCAALRAVRPSPRSTASCLGGQQQAEVTTSQGRRRKPTLAPAAAGETSSRPAKRPKHQPQQQLLAEDSTAAVAVQPPRTRRRGRPAAEDQATNDELIAALVDRTQLPRATAEHVVAARSKTPHIPTQPDKLCYKVQCLQQLLGTDNANLALRRFPSIVAYSSANLAFNYSQWQLFFGMADTPTITTAVSSSSPNFSQTLQAARAQALQRKLAGRPQLLSAQVEELVANYYEIAHMLGCEDYHAFAYKALDVGGSLTPDAVQDKMLRVLEVVNTGIQRQQQQRQQQQQQRPPGYQQDQQDHSSQGSTPAADAAPEDVEGPQLLTLSDLQAAARRDLCWLVLAADTLEQRLTDLQQELGVSMSAVGAMFLRNPSLLNKKPTSLAAKAAALRALPGLQPEQAAAAMAAMPSLLNLNPARLQDRWQRLQQAASSHPSWRTALDQMPPSSLACLLVRGEGRYQRMQQAVDLGLQDRLPLSSVFNMPDSYFAARLAKVTQAAARPAAPAGRQA